FRHVFRNAVVPIVNLIPGSLLMTISGSIYTESFYSIPGMGGLLVDVIKRQDNNMVMVLVVLFAAVGIVGLLLGDIAMALVDPRISFTKKEGSR
ncbi:MAG: ABC transporter permease subunit, partial [Firmicutes bacterium]|nr:ABC transporter permease subunit [Bacillota bacterium]